MLNMSEKCSGQCQSSSTNEDVKIVARLSVHLKYLKWTVLQKRD